MLRQILEAIDQFAPDAVLFGFDDRRSSEREDVYPAYKAGRAEKDPALIDQLERGAALLDALGLRTVTPAGLEADDVSASASTWAEERGWSCVIVTSDRDAFAHISEHTQVLRLITGGIDGSPLLNPTRLRASTASPPSTTSSTPRCAATPATTCPACPASARRPRPCCSRRWAAMQAVWADIDHCGGATLVATLDSCCEEEGLRRIGAGLLKQLSDARRARALRLQHLDHVRPRPSTSGSRPRRPAPPACSPSTPTGSPASSATSTCRRPPSSPCGCSPSRRRRAATG